MLPERIVSPEQLADLTEEIGFLPLFSGGIPGFSVEEHTRREDWWTGDPERDPWHWRTVLAREHRVAYGKFFRGRAGFLSPEWLPVFAAYRRDGYDFDALWDDGLAGRREKQIMDLMQDGQPRFSYVIRRETGFGRDGEKGFEGSLTKLQHMLYLTITDFGKRTGKHGLEYGWDIAVLATPESVWGYDLVTGCYAEGKARCRERVLDRIRTFYPDADEAMIRSTVGSD